MNINELKSLLDGTVDSLGEAVSGYARELMAIPEMGYKENKTAAYVREKLESFGYRVDSGIGMTGLRAVLKGKNSYANVAVMGELDAVTCPTHPSADPETGAAHACGHNIQLANLLGVAEALAKSKAGEYFDGDVTLMAVPAEEFVELEYRDKLRRDGKIGKFAGKQELLELGAFDGVDMAMMVHSQAGCPERKLFIGGSGLGFVAKTVRFIGKESHAGGAPHEGVNALNAAMAALMCIHAMRETFRDEDKIRVHPIITHGGDLVNIVPANVVMETYVRGATVEAVHGACFKVDRAIKGAAYALGCEVEITDVGGYEPLRQDKALTELFASNTDGLVAPECVISGVDMIGSTDVGDLCTVMPAIQPTLGGFTGSAHSREFMSVDAEFTDIVPVKLMLRTLADLLTDGAQKARTIREKFDNNKK